MTKAICDLFQLIVIACICLMVIAVGVAAWDVLVGWVRKWRSKK